MLGRLIDNWVYGGFLAGLLLLGLTPVLAHSWPLALTLVFLALPIYMLHQYEEHDADRFHRKINQVFGKGRNVLPSGAIFIINIPIVWGVNAISFAAATFDLGWGLIALYTLIANAVVHIAQAAVSRAYNPGLITAVALFLPLGIFGAIEITRTVPVSSTQQMVAVALAVGAHVAIQAYVFSNVRRLAKDAMPQ
ncbi:MAG: hypothetical protein JWR75_770 [Devosia sp.]|nr:hypothetical protein [Devosia sp.]